MRTRSMFSDRLGGAPHSKQSLRLWLKLLGCTMIVEKRLRARLDAEFATTLPRFDVLAALERHAQGLKHVRPVRISHGLERQRDRASSPG